MSTNDDTAVVLRPAHADDAPAVAKIWYDGWRDGHLGHVDNDLVAARTPESFGLRASQRVGDTAVAIVNGAVAGFVMVVGDEVEQVYVSTQHRGSGVAATLLAEAERLVKANGHEHAWLAVVAGNARARRFYARSGWIDEGLFDYQAETAMGPITVPSHRYVKRLRGQGVNLRIQCLNIDTADPAGLASFWESALGWRRTHEQDDEVVLEPPAGSPEDGVVPDLLFARVPEEKIVKNRLHLDLRPIDQAAEVARLESLGARRVDVGQGADVTWVVMADPHGNEFCVLRPLPPELRGA